MVRVLVTGVNGFIGTHLAQRLIGEGYEVHGIIKPSITRNLTNFHQFLKGVKITSCDITDYYSTNNTIREINPEVVVHLAALSPVRDSFEKPFSYINTNIVGTTNILQATLNLGEVKGRKLVYASTAEVYGNQKEKPTSEDAALNPTSPYAITKASTDMYVRMAAAVYGIDTTVMRCTNSYGRKFDKSFFVEYLITSMLKREKVYLGAPNSIRDYMYVDDHVNAYVKAIQVIHKSGEAFNFAVRNEMTNKDVAFLIADKLDFNRENIILGKYPSNYPLRPGISDQPFISLDTTKAKKIFGWEPTVNISDGLDITIQHWKDKMNS